MRLLYRAKDLSKVDYSGYIRNLTNYLFQSYCVDENTIKLKINIEDVLMGINEAIPVGLIINELVSNSLKYAFPGGRKGEIQVKFIGNKGFYSLIIGDNGIGLPGNIDYQLTESLGLQLVNTLVDQLGGTIKLENNGGTKFIIIFKM